MLIDSHCHLDRLDLAPYGHDFARFIEQTTAAGVAHMLCVSISLEAFGPMRELVLPHDCVSLSVGVHPNERECHEPTVEELTALAADPRIVAIGETGLDYFRSEGDLDWQHRRFRQHIRAARETRKPLIIHTRDARDDTLRILEEENAAEVGGVLHCFTEDWATAERALDLNFYVSFSGIVTFRNAAQIQDAARRLPADRLLIETDSPYLAPIPHRGKPNYPAYVGHVATMIAGLRETTAQGIAELSNANYQRLFGAIPGAGALKNPPPPAMHD